jgi:hypothetical protein
MQGFVDIHYAAKVVDCTVFIASPVTFGRVRNAAVQVTVSPVYKTAAV